MAQKRKLDYYDDDFDFDTEILSSFESDEDFMHIISSSEDDTSDEENFSSVRQCDESTFEILQNKVQFVHRRSGEKIYSDCVVQTVKHPTKIMIWSVISGKSAGRLYVVKGMMRQDQYKGALQNCLMPQLEEWFPNGESYIFMQDGASCRTAQSIKSFLAEKNIPLLDWPGIIALILTQSKTFGSK
ncbi:uncharacterized protein TNCV_5037871 [Trichonephila clavipes]|nr:uncharacterized protein TNCV_5037871 [Trichonephila clavipes]